MRSPPGSEELNLFGPAGRFSLPVFHRPEAEPDETIVQESVREWEPGV